MALSSLFGLKTEVCGIDIGQHTVRGAQLRSARQHAPLLGMGEAALPKKVFDKDKITDLDGFAKTILEVIQNAQPHPITAKAVVAALPETLIFTRVIQLPNLPPPELKKAIPYEASQFLPIPVENVYFDYIPLALRPDKQQIDVAIFAAPKELVDGLIDVIHRAGLELYALETKSTAILRSLIPAGTEEAALIMEIGSESTRMTIADHGNVWLTTSFNVGEIQLIKAIATKLGKPEADIRTHLANHQGDEINKMLVEVVGPIVQEAISATRYHETRDYHPSKTHRAIIVGQGATIPGVIPAIIGSLHIKCEPGLPLVSGTPNIDLKFSVALGLSMRAL